MEATSEENPPFGEGLAAHMLTNMNLLTTFSDTRLTGEKFQLLQNSVHGTYNYHSDTNSPTFTTDRMLELP